MLGLFGFIKKKLEMDGKLLDKWKGEAVLQPAYYCFTRLENGSLRYMYLPAGSAPYENATLYTKYSNASGGGAFARVETKAEMDEAVANNHNNSTITWDGVSSTAVRAGWFGTVDRSPENDLYE